MTYRRINRPQPAKVVGCLCARCYGNGKYAHYGTCYRCGGCGRDPVHRDWGFPADWTDEQCEAFLAAREAKRVARAEKARARRADEAAELLNQNNAACPALAEDDGRHATNWERAFLRDLRARASKYVLTARQIEMVNAIREKIAAREAEQAAVTAVPEGRIAIEGEVLTLRDDTATFHGRTVCTTKMLLKCTGGYRVWGTAPAAIVGDVKRGDRVRLTATVKRGNEHGFGFFARPAAAEIVANTNVCDRV